MQKQANGVSIIPKHKKHSFIYTMHNKTNYQNKKENTTGKCQSLPIYFIQNSSNVEYGNYLLLPHTQVVNIPSQCLQFGGEG